MNEMMKKNVKILLIVGCLVVLLSVAIISAIIFDSEHGDSKDSSPNIYNFESCQEADGTILESFPEQCQIEGETYTRVVEDIIEDDLDIEPPSTNDIEDEVVAEETITLDLYFTSDELIASNCGATVKTTRTIPFTTGVARAALLELFEGPLNEGVEADHIGSFEGWSDAFNTINLSEDGTLEIDFLPNVISAPYNLSNYGTSCGTGAWQQIYKTMKQFPTVNYVVFSVDGSRETFTGFAYPRGCPVEQAVGESNESFLEAQKQCDSL